MHQSDLDDFLHQVLVGQIPLSVLSSFWFVVFFRGKCFGSWPIQITNKVFQQHQPQHCFVHQQNDTWHFVIVIFISLQCDHSNKLWLDAALHSAKHVKHDAASLCSTDLPIG